MSSLNYSNPNTPYKVGVQSSIPPTSTIGLSFSVFDTGGYMELYNITDLIWYYNGGFGQITGSTIPINFVKGTKLFVSSITISIFFKSSLDLIFVEFDKNFPGFIDPW